MSAAPGVRLRMACRRLVAAAFAGMVCVSEAGDVDGAGMASRAAAAAALAADIPFLSVNLNNYKHPANPVLCGATGEWDEAGIERPVVLRVGPEDWRMWYACAGAQRSIGLATSKDGVRWTKHPGNPVLPPAEAWEQGYMSPTSVLRVNGRFHLYYWGPSHVYPDRATGRRPPPRMKYIVLAVSDDGIRWTRTGALDGLKGAVLGPAPEALNEGASGGGSGVDAAKVFYLPEERTRPWRMIYTGFGPHGQWNGLADSEDGIAWRKTVAPVAGHSGFHAQATGDHHDSGQTIRCPVRIGSVWAGLSLELDSHDSAPAVASSLDQWTVLGRRVLYANQDYERRAVAPYAMEADEEWFHLYYSTGNRTVGLVRAPKRSVHQPILLWDKADAGPAGLLSHVVEADGRAFHLHVASAVDGEVRVIPWNPASKEWMGASPLAVRAGEPFLLSPVPPHARFRVGFTPRTGTGALSAWLVTQ